MPTELGTRYDWTYNGNPPHMAMEDREIWERLRSRIDDKDLGIYFDVGLGAGREAPTDTPPNIANMWTRLNQKRADVVLDYPTHVIILELRNAAQANAIGRLDMYRMLWHQDPPIAKPLTLWLATNTYDQDVAALAKARDITYLVV